MTNVTPLRPDAPTGEPHVSEVCVDVLRDLLQRAEAGEVTGVGLAALHCNGDASYHVAGHIGGFSMLGALDMVRAELVEINKVDE